MNRDNMLRWLATDYAHECEYPFNFRYLYQSPRYSLDAVGRSLRMFGTQYWSQAVGCFGWL